MSATPHNATPTWARHLAAQAWCTPTTSHITLDPGKGTSEGLDKANSNMLLAIKCEVALAPTQKEEA